MNFFSILTEINPNKIMDNTKNAITSAGDLLKKAQYKKDSEALGQPVVGEWEPAIPSMIESAPTPEYANRLQGARDVKFPEENPKNKKENPFDWQVLMPKVVSKVAPDLPDDFIQNGFNAVKEAWSNPYEEFILTEFKESGLYKESKPDVEQKGFMFNETFGAKGLNMPEFGKNDFAEQLKEAHNYQQRDIRNKFAFLPIGKKEEIIKSAIDKLSIDQQRKTYGYNENDIVRAWYEDSENLPFEKRVKVMGNESPQKQFEQLPEEEKKKYEELAKKKKEPALLKHLREEAQIEALRDSIHLKYGSDVAKEWEKQYITAKGVERIQRGAVTSAVGAMTLGISDVVTRELIGETPAEYFGDNRKLAAYYKENKKIAETFDQVKNVTDIAASFAGGMITYGAIAGKVKAVLEGVPGVAGAWMKAHPIITAYTAQGIGEEVVEMSIRKMTGQEYGWNEFMLGMAMNTGFESAFRGARKASEVFLAYKANHVKIGEAVENSLIKAEQAKGARLTQVEIAKAIYQTPINDQFSLGDLYKEVRLAHKTGLVGSMGERGMTSLKSQNIRPSVTDVGVKISAEPEGVRSQGVDDSLIAEAKKYDTSEEFVKEIDSKVASTAFKEGILSPEIDKAGRVKIHSNSQIEYESKLTDIWKRAHGEVSGTDSGAIRKTGANKPPDAGKISEEAAMKTEIDNEKLPWETEEEWKTRIGDSGLKEVNKAEFIGREKPPLEGKKYLEYQADKMITDYVEQNLKTTMGKGATKGGLIRDVDGYVTGRFGAVSENEQWFKDFYRKNNRGPTSGELREIAVDHLEKGYQGIELSFEPNKDFIAIKSEMDEMGIKIPAKKLPKAVKGEKKPLTVEKESIRNMAKKGNDLLDLKLEDTDRAEYVRKLAQQIKAREAVEQSIKDGTYAPAGSKLQTVRKGGGITQAGINLVDKVAGIPAEIAGKLGNKGINSVAKVIDEWNPKGTFGKMSKGLLTGLPQKHGLSDSAFKEIEGFRFARQREDKMMSLLFKEFKSEMKGLDSKEIQNVKSYLLGEKVEVPEKVRPILETVAKERDIEGLRQVMLGNVSPEVYFSNKGYLRRLYEAHNVEGFEVQADKYNNLKNTLIEERGITGEKAEEVITEIASGNIKQKTQQMISTGLKTKGDFTKARKLGDDPVSLAIRDFLGEIQDPVYLMMRTLRDTKTSRLNAQFLESLSKTESVKDKIPAGQFDKYVKLKGDNWGALDGKYMERQIYDHFQMINNHSIVGNSVVAEVSKAGRWLNNHMKFALTAGNPGGQVRNVVTNFKLSRAILGVNYTSASGMNDLRKAIKSIFDRDEFYQELLAYGRLGDSGFNKELGIRLEDTLDSAIKGKKSAADVYGLLESKLGKAYEAGDNLFLMANYKKLRAKGLQPLEALKEANRVTPDYGAVSPLLQSLRSEIFGVPFITWRAKVYPELVKQLFKTPLRTTQSLWRPLVVGTAIAQGLDLTDEEQNIFWLKMLRDGEMPLFRDPETGDVVYHDFGQYTPYADMFKSKYTKKGEFIGLLVPEEVVPDQLEGYIQGMIPGIGSFPVQAIVNIKANYDPFFQKPIYKEGDDTFTKLTDIAAYLSPQTLPVIGTSIRGVQGALKQGRPVGEAVLRALTGLKIKKQGVGAFEESEKYRDADYSLDTNETTIRERVRDIVSLSKTNAEKAETELNELYEKYPEYEKLINDRFDSETDKSTGKNKAYDEIRTEIKSLFNIAEKDPDIAEKRLNALYEKYPEYEAYISKKFDEFNG